MVRDVPSHDAHDDSDGDEDRNHHGAGFLCVQWFVTYQVTMPMMTTKTVRTAAIVMVLVS